MKRLKRVLLMLLCLLTIAGILYIPATATAAGLPASKAVSVTVKLSGVHPASDFPETRAYDDGTYSGTLSRQNSTLRSTVRATPTVTNTTQSDTTYPTDKPVAGQYNFPATYSTAYLDPVSGQSFTVVLSKFGAPYFSGTAVTKYLYWTHYGYQYDPENHTKLGYMSNNTSTYYSGQYRFADPPRQPSTYYGPPAEEGLGWVQYKAPEWDGALQDATKEPWKSLCLFWHGVQRFVSDTTGTQNRYRKPVRLFYRRSASCKYIYQGYSGTVSVTDTEITYTGIVYLKNTGPAVSIAYTPSVPYAGDYIHIDLYPTDPDGGNLLLSATIQYMGEDNTTPGAVVTICSNTSIPSGNRYEYVLANALKGYYRVTATVVDEGGLSASAVLTIAVNQALPDVTVISANTEDWYAGKDVVVSALIRNTSAQAVPSVKVRLKAGGIQKDEMICVLANGSNLAVFRFTVPSPPNPPGTMPLTVTVIVDPDDAIGESNEGNNTCTKTQTVLSVPPSFVVDPDMPELEQNHLSRNKAIPAIPQVMPSSYHTWQEVRLENGNYVTKTFWAELNTVFELSPDPRVAIPDNPDRIESGFGVQANCRTVLTTNYDHPEKLIGPQMVWVYAPESSYGQGQWQDVRDALETCNGNAGNKSIQWQVAVNPYSTTACRLHYIPLWFPDEQYTELAQSFYAWSPVGQMVGYGTDSVIIEGDMYDRVTAVRR